MEEFINEIDSLYWWLSVVVVGLIINLLSSYLKSPIDLALSKLSSVWKARSQRKKAERAALISKLKASDREFYYYCVYSTESQLRAIQNIILAVVIAAFGLIASSQYPGIEIVGYVGGTFYFINGLRHQRKRDTAKSIISDTLENA